MIDRVHAAFDLTLQVLLAGIGLMYSREEDCKLPVTTYLAGTGLVYAAFAAMRLLGADVTLCNFQVNNLLPVLNLGFVYWGRTATWDRLGEWTFSDASADGYCGALPMAAGGVALMVQLSFLFLTLFSMVGVLVIAFLLWLVTYSTITGSVVPYLFSGLFSTLSGLGGGGGGGTDKGG